MSVKIPVAIGELFDKITILRIKRDRLRDPAKLANVTLELEALERIASGLPRPPGLDGRIDELQTVNDGLWDVEDAKRAHERERRFDADFIALSRRVYLENDRRAAIKREINLMTGSGVLEEKSHG